MGGDGEGWTACSIYGILKGPGELPVWIYYGCRDFDSVLSVMSEEHIGLSEKLAGMFDICVISSSVGRQDLCAASREGTGKAPLGPYSKQKCIFLHSWVSLHTEMYRYVLLGF